MIQRRKPLKRGKPPRRTAIKKKPLDPDKVRLPRGKIARSRYLHPAWRERRAKALRRDQHRCQVKAPDCTGEATQVHHLRYERGNGWRSLLVPLDDLVSVCCQCHEGLEKVKRGEDVEPPFLEE